MCQTQTSKPIDTCGSTDTGARTPDPLQVASRGWAPVGTSFRDPCSPHLESGLRPSCFTSREHPLGAIPTCVLAVSEEWTLLLPPHLDPNSKLTSPI